MIERQEMRLFPRSQVKTFGECAHSEFIEYSSRGKNHSGLCILDEAGQRYILYLASDNPDLLYRLMPFARDNEVLALGPNWALSPCGRIGTPDDAYKEKGNIVCTTQGTFMVAIEIRQQIDQEVLCRLDQEEVLDLSARPHGGFSYKQWKINYFDQELNARQCLASKQAQELD